MTLDDATKLLRDALAAIDRRDGSAWPVPATSRVYLRIQTAIKRIEQAQDDQRRIEKRENQSC